MNALAVCYSSSSVSVMGCRALGKFPYIDALYSLARWLLNVCKL